MQVQEVLPRDAIPSIDDPKFGTKYFGDPDDEVIVVEGTPPRAYPVRILNYHEIVNDVVPLPRGEGASPQGEEERPIAVTWCPICASAVVYERTVEGRVLTFGTSGKLADDALVMYDRETGSEWKQPLGTAIAGEFEGRELVTVQASMLSWDRFRTEFPDGVVLQPVYGSDGDPRGRTPREAYDTAGYERYHAAEEFGLRAMRGEGPRRTWDRSDLDPKSVVLGIAREDDAVGYPVTRVEAEGGLVYDSVGGNEVVVVTVDGEIHAFEAPEFAVELQKGVLRGDGTVWDPATGRSEDGRQLTPVPARRLYAFTWQDDHGPDSFFET